MLACLLWSCGCIVQKNGPQQFDPVPEIVLRWGTSGILISIQKWMRFWWLYHPGKWWESDLAEDGSCGHCCWSRITIIRDWHSGVPQTSRSRTSTCTWWTCGAQKTISQLGKWFILPHRPSLLICWASAPCILSARLDYVVGLQLFGVSKLKVFCSCVYYVMM